MGIVNWLRDLLPRKEIHIDPSSLKEHHVNKALQYENAELKAERDKVKNEIAKLRKSQEDIDEEEEVKLSLNQKKEELQHIKATKYFSLGGFFKKYYKDKKFAGKVFYTDFERGEKLDKFKDFGFSEDGQFVVIGRNGVIMKMENLKDIFQSIRGLNNDIGAGKIPLNLDGDGAWIENVMEYEVPEIQRTSMGLQYYKARKKPLYEIIAEKNQLIAEIRKELEEQEEVNAELNMEVDSLKRGLRLNESTAETLMSDMTEVEGSSGNITRAFQNMARRLESESNQNTILEENLDKLENQIETIRGEAEREGVKLSDNKAMETIKTIRRELVRDEPTKEVQVVQVPSQPVQPLPNSPQNPKNPKI